MKSFLLYKRNITYLNIILSIAIFFASLFLIRDLILFSSKEKNGPKNMKETSSVSKEPPMKNRIEDYKMILSNNPFGISGGEIRSLNMSLNFNNKDSHNKEVDILLLGTVSGPKELSYAIFADSKGKQEIFKIGESVFGIGILKAVKEDRVLIKNDARVIEIPFEELKIKEIKKGDSEAMLPNNFFARKIGSGHYVVDQNKIQQMIANPTQMMTDARLKPNVVNGKEEGFILSEVKPGGIYSALGLQNGDILLRINEYDISNPERALQAFTALRGLDRIQLDLIRNGAKMTMTYQIK